MPWASDERDEFLKRLAMLAEVLGEPVTPGRMMAYAAVLDDVPIACVLCGIDEAMRESRWFPKPVELRELGERSRPWKRQQEARFAAFNARRQRALGPPLSDEEIRSNIAKLKAVVAGLASKRRMR